MVTRQRQRGRKLTALELPDPVGELTVCRALLPARVQREDRSDLCGAAAQRRFFSLAGTVKR